MSKIVQFTHEDLEQAYNDWVKCGETCKRIQDSGKDIVSADEAVEVIEALSQSVKHVPILIRVIQAFVRMDKGDHNVSLIHEPETIN